MTSAWEEIDEWGPEKVLQVFDPYTGMKGVLVIDNTSTGSRKRRYPICSKYHAIRSF